MTPRPHHRRSKRAAQRGAAMVEGIVIMTTMLVFLGMNVWVTQAYGGKVDQMSSTRRDVLYFASHSCAERNSADPDTYTVPALRGISGGQVSTEAADPGGAGGPEGKVAGAITSKTGGGEAAAVQKNWNSAVAGKGPVAVTGAAIVNTTPDRGINLAKAGLTTTVATNSYSGCNEKRYDNAWTQLFAFGWDFFKSAGGLL